MEEKDIFLSVCSPDTVHIGSTLDNSAQSPFLCPLTERLLMTVSIIDIVLPCVKKLTAEGKPLAYQTDGRVRIVE